MHDRQPRRPHLVPPTFRGTPRALLAILALLASTAPAWAQDTGGVRLAPNMARGPVGIAQPLPFTLPSITAADLQGQGRMAAADRQARNQDMIARLRGDAGYLAGFSFGQPLALSRQKPPQGGGFGFDDGSAAVAPELVINNLDGPIAIAVGNSNVIQQQTAHGSGPIAQQQVATVSGKTQQVPSAPGSAPGGLSLSAGAGALNIVTGNGNIVQRAPGQR
jgi:hypothetical protein